jgi:hypothetical protein
MHVYALRRVLKFSVRRSFILCCSGLWPNMFRDCVLYIISDCNLTFRRCKLQASLYRGTSQCNLQFCDTISIEVSTAICFSPRFCFSGLWPCMIEDFSKVTLQTVIFWFVTP